MDMEARMTRLTAVIAALGWLCTMPALAESYPAKPVTIVVAYPAGGATDVLARAVGRRLEAAWGRPVVIENKGGASTQIAAADVAKAAPDGNTLLATDGTTFINRYLRNRVSYDAEKAFIPVTGLGIVHQTLVVHPSVSANTVADFIALAKAKPVEVNYATLGIGSSSHLNMEKLERMAGVTLTAVHYKGGAPALTDVIGGHVPAVFLSVMLVAEPCRAGMLRPLGVGSNKRLAQFPNWPTIAETVPGYEATVWFGLFAPSNTPQEIVVTINAEVQRILADPAFHEKFLIPNYYEPFFGSPDEFAAYVRTDAMKWGEVIKTANLTID
jgi:tripartite-type tricarboxylate transporter receptor subunit TctC